MSNYSNAIEQDILGNLSEAVGFYEKSILEENEVNSYVNLTAIYWNISSDYGVESYVLTNNIFTKTKIDSFGNRYAEVLSEGLKKYPDDLSLVFWNTYINEHNSYDDHNSKDLMYDLIRKNKNCIEPYFYLYVFCNDTSISDNANDLIPLLKQELTFKNKYILSFLE